MDDVRAISFRDEETYKTELQHVIKSKLGNGVFVSKSPQDKNFEGIIGTYVPEIIDDSKRDERIIRFLKFNSIGTFEIKRINKSVSIFLPDRNELSRNITNEISKLRFNVEMALLQKTYNKLVGITPVLNALTPIKAILDDLHLHNEASFKDIEKDRKDRALKYVNFLESLALVERENDKLTQGNQFKYFEAELKNKSKKDFYTALLAYILENGIGYIREYLSLTAITSYIRWQTSYYLSASEKGALLYWNRKDLIQNRNELYKIRPISFNSASNQITNLVDAEIFEDDGEYISGKEDILKSAQVIINRF